MIELDAFGAFQVLLNQLSLIPQRKHLLFIIILINIIILCLIRRQRRLFAIRNEIRLSLTVRLPLITIVASLHMSSWPCFRLHLLTFGLHMHAIVLVSAA